MRRLILLISLMVVGCLTTPLAVAQTSCRPADQYGAYLVNKITSFMQNARPTDSASRSGLQLPLVATNDIALVTDSLTCSRALTAYNAALGPRGTGSTASTQLTVVKVGNDRYVVLDPNQTAGEYIYEMTLDANFEVLVISGT